MNPRFLLVACIFLSSLPVFCSEEFNYLNDFERSSFYSHTTKGKYSDLNIPVECKDGEITYFADQKDVTTFSISLYLVNRTHHDIYFTGQDGFYYTFQEGLFFNGKWVRSQTHKSSWCGNSVCLISLSNDEYLKTSSYYPSSGVRTKVRYCSPIGFSKEFPGNIATFGLKSNEIEGFVRLDDIQKTMHDDFSDEYREKHGGQAFENIFERCAILSVTGHENPTADSVQFRKAFFEICSLQGDRRFFSIVAYLLKVEKDEFKEFILKNVSGNYDDLRQRLIPSLKNYNMQILPNEVFDCLASDNLRIKIWALRAIKSYFEKQK